MSISLQNQTSFVVWLQSEMEKRGWNQAELSERADTTLTSIYNIINHDRRAMPQMCLLISEGLNIPPEIVLRKAGWLPEPDPYRELTDYLRYLAPEHRDSLVAIARDMIARCRFGQANLLRA